MLHTIFCANLLARTENPENDRTSTSAIIPAELVRAVLNQKDSLACELRTELIDRIQDISRKTHNVLDFEDFYVVISQVLDEIFSNLEQPISKENSFVHPSDIAYVKNKQGKL